MGTKTIKKSKNHSKSKLKDKVASTETHSTLSINFSKFHLAPVRLSGTFNNHFKDNEQLQKLLSELLGKILPKISSETYKELQRDAKQLHFHTIDEEHRRIVREVLKEYSFSDNAVEQMFEGNNLCEFSASLGHVIPSRAICHKVGNVLYLLFLDVNHHVYFNQKYTEESLYYEHCPVYLEGDCSYMPNDCFAVEYLDKEMLWNSFK